MGVLTTVLEMWSSTVIRVWYIFSAETKTKEKMEIKNRTFNLHQNEKVSPPYGVLCC